MIVPLKIDFFFHNNKKDNIKLVKLFINEWVELCEFDSDYNINDIEIISNLDEKKFNNFNIDLPEFNNGFNLVPNLIKVLSDKKYKDIEITYVQGNDDNQSLLELIKIYINKNNFEITYLLKESLKIYKYVITISQNELSNFLNKDIIRYTTQNGILSTKELEKDIKNIEDIISIEFTENNEFNLNNPTEHNKTLNDILDNIIDNIEKGILNPTKNKDYYSINIMYLLLDHPKFEEVTEEEMMDENSNSLYSKTESEILNRILKYYDENNISYTYESIEELSIEELNELMKKI